MRTKILIAIVPALLAGYTTFAPHAARAQEIIPLDKVVKSQPAVVSQTIANTDITIKYSRPVARGRALFGALVPYDQVWHPGANDASHITVTRDVQIQGKPLVAGKYGIWAIPRTDTWTVIFSKAADVWHQPYPGEDKDALRVDSKSERGAHMETLSYYFPVVDGKDAVLRIHWGEVIVPLAISVP
jgi:hypothetical protein